MKRSIYHLLILCFSLLILPFSSNTQNIDETGFEGDHFSLEAALELLKNSKNLENFEKKLNDESNHVNNLDLNKDGETDYIRVFDNMEGDVHAIVLNIAVSASESQDIAVIEIEKTSDNMALLQIIGDEEVFGEQVIVEPYDVEVGDSKGRGGPSEFSESYGISVNVMVWPSVRYIYRSSYVAYSSSWKWMYYPRWWKPWKPWGWTVWHPYRIKYTPGYRVVSTHRVVRAHKIYTPKRKTSTVVASRTKVVKTTRINKKGTKVSASSTKTVVAGKKADGTKAVAVKSNNSLNAKTADGKKLKASKSTTKGVAKNKKGAVAGKKTSKSTKVKTKKGVAGKKKTTKTKVKKKKGKN